MLVTVNKLNNNNKKNLICTTHLWGIEFQGTVDTGSHARKDDPGISFKPFSPPINEGNDGAWVQNAIFINQ